LNFDFSELGHYAMIGMTWAAGFSTVMFLFVALLQVGMPEPSVQLVENKLQENKTVCVEHDIDWKPGYPDGSWQSLEELPEQGVVEYSNYSALKGVNVWVKLDTEKANLTPPSKMNYKAVTECIEYRKIPKYKAKGERP